MSDKENQFCFEITVNEVRETETFGSNNFKKRELIGTTSGEYPSTYCFEFVQDKVNLLDNIDEGDIITVHFNVRSREHQGKYYTSLSGWRIEK